MNLDLTCRKIAKELNLDFDLVKDIVQFEFLFTKNIMQDPADYRDILFNRLFRFSLKNRFKNDKTKEYNP